MKDWLAKWMDQRAAEAERRCEAALERKDAELALALECNHDLRAEVAILRREIDALGRLNEALMTWCPSDLREMEA